MHGLIFETSICYWQDQPGRGKREHTEPGVPGRGARRGAGDTAVAAGGAGGRPHPHPTSGEGAGRRRTPGPDRQPAPPAARTADRLRPGQRGVAAWRDEGGGKGGRPHRGSPRTSDPHPTNQSGAARNLGGPGAGPRAPAGRSGGRPARARSPALTRTGGGGGGSGRGPATPHLPARPTGAGRRGHGGRSATAGRGPDDPRSGERAGAGRGAARQGDGRRSPQPRPTRNDAGGRAAAADHGAVPRQAREAKHTGTRPGGRQTRRTGDRADEARLARPPPRRRGDDLAEDVAGGGGRAPTRGRPGGHPKGTDASRPPGHDTGSHRQRPPAQGRSRGTQDADWPPRPPNQGAPPSRGSRPPPPNTHEPRPAPRQQHSPARTPAAPRAPPHASAAAPDSPASGTVSTPPGDAARRGGRGAGDTLTWARPARSQTGKGARRAGGRGGPAATGRGRHAHTQRRGPRGRGAGAPAQGQEGPRHDRARQGNKRGVPPPHTRGRSHDTWDAGRPRPPWGSPTTRPRRRGPCATVSPRVTRRDPSAQTQPPPSSPHPPSSESDPRGSRPRETLPSEATRTVPTHRPRPRLAARAGATGSSRLRDWGVGTSVRPRTPPRARHRAGHRTRTHTAPRRTPAWRDPPPTQRGEARAAVGKERHSAPPRGRRKPSREGEGLCRPRGSGSGHRGPLHAWEGQRLGGPARPPGSGRGEHAREARQTPPSRRPRPNTIAPTPVCDSPHTRKWGRRHTRRRPGHEVSPPPRHTVGGRWRRGGRPPSPTEGEKQRQDPAPFTVSTPPREPLTGHTTAAETPRSTLGKGNDTTARPRAPEGRPGALQGHHRGPSKSRSRAGSGRAAQRRDGPHRRGEDRPQGTRQGGEARASAASEDHGPAHAVRREAGDRRSGPETTTPAPPTHPSAGRQGVTREARGPRTEREERSRSPRTSVPRLARLKARPRRARHHHIDQSIQRAGGHEGPEGGGARRGPSPEEPASASAGTQPPPSLSLAFSGNSGRRPREENA
nr:collagen alpha-1(I) chain-like [Globicephala melas]